MSTEQWLLHLQHTIHKKKVLLIDRNASSRESLRLMFGSLGINSVQGAGSAAEVLRQVKNTRFDIILSEFILEDARDGQQLLEELRQAKYIPLSTVYIIVSSERAYTNVMALAELFPDDYLVKPFTAEQLQPRLIRAIYKKHILQKIYERLEAENLPEALAACDRVIQQNPALSLEAARQKGSILLKLGLFPEAEKLYQQIIAENDSPWAKMGLAIALKERGKLKESQALALKLLESSPHFLAIHDFLATLYQEEGNWEAAQEILLKASESSPNNTLRQRAMGDVAMQNDNFTLAQKAFGKVIERSRGSSLCKVDDFGNLARVYLAKKDVESSRKLMNDLKREFRGDLAAELTAMTFDALCLEEEGLKAKAQSLLNTALILKEQCKDEDLSPQQSTDLALACLKSGKKEEGEALIRQIAFENFENKKVLAQLDKVFKETHLAENTQELLASIAEEIETIDEKSAAALKKGDWLGNARLMREAVQKIPGTAFLIKAALAIFTLLEHQGWDHDWAVEGLSYLQRAKKKEPDNPKLPGVFALYAMVAKKYGVTTQLAL